MNHLVKEKVSMKVEVLVARRLKCGEAPHWDHENNRLLFVDITGKKCFVFDWETKEVSKC